MIITTTRRHHAWRGTIQADGSESGVSMGSKLARQSGRDHQLITGDKTQVTNNAAKGTKVIRRKDLGPK